MSHCNDSDTEFDDFFDPELAPMVASHHLPHWQQGSVPCFVTWRLADALPAGRLQELEAEKSAWLASHVRPWSPAVLGEFQRRFRGAEDRILDSGAGSCLLREPPTRELVASTLRFFHGAKYTLCAFVVMPNHVHVLFRPGTGETLSDLIGSWKGYSATMINRLHARKGMLWQADYWDRLIRNEAHFLGCREYIKDNPVRARLHRHEFALWTDEDTS